MAGQFFEWFTIDFDPNFYLKFIQIKLHGKLSSQKIINFRVNVFQEGKKPSRFSSRRFPHLRPTSRRLSSMRRRLSLGDLEDHQIAHFQIWCIFLALLAAYVWDINSLLVFATENAICQRKNNSSERWKRHLFRICLLLLFFELFHDISWSIQKKCSKFKSVTSRFRYPKTTCFHVNSERTHRERLHVWFQMHERL